MMIRDNYTIDDPDECDNLQLAGKPEVKPNALPRSKGELPTINEECEESEASSYLHPEDLKDKAYDKKFKEDLKAFQNMIYKSGPLMNASYGHSTPPKPSALEKALLFDNRDSEE
jgi:hypothetical protein